MRIKIKYLLLIILVALVGGYILAMFAPFDFWRLTIKDEPISKGEHYSNIISAIGALGTVFAVIVALFLEDIKSFFKKVHFDIQFKSHEILEELEETPDTSKKAKRYHNAIRILNTGNINANNCELYIESLIYSNGSIKNPIPLPIKNTRISWEFEKRDEVYIPSMGEKLIEVIEILAPEAKSTPSETAAQIPPKLKIAGVETKDEYMGGKWVAHFCLYSSNATRPHKFKIIIDWDGSWYERQSEMKNVVDIKLER